LPKFHVDGGFCANINFLKSCFILLLSSQRNCSDIAVLIGLS
jgi:hypothetical protein